MSAQLLLEFSLIGTVTVLTFWGVLRSRKNGTSIAETFTKFLTGLLGAFLLMAGTVKFFDPFTTMFTTQIAMSELPFPFLSRWAGQLGEMGAGILFLAVLLIGKKLQSDTKNRLFYAASLLTTIIMIVAVYVHLLPGVPAEVLPLQSKPPVLTLVIMAMVGLNAYLFKKSSQVSI